LPFLPSSCEMATKKTFALGSLLRDKSEPRQRADEEELSSIAPDLSPATTQAAAEEGHAETALTGSVTAPGAQAPSAPSAVTTISPATSGPPATVPPVLPAFVSNAAAENQQTSGRRKPGPKGRGLYKKRTIDLPIDLDEFVENARRTHVRPNGRASTIYTHFIEDLIAAERNKRALH
jgi:hypothetical protein